MIMGFIIFLITTAIQVAMLIRLLTQQPLRTKNLNRKGCGGSVLHTQSIAPLPPQVMPPTPQKSKENPSGLGFSFDVFPFRD